VDGSGTRGTWRRGQEAQGNGPKGSARPDLAQGRRRRAELARRANRRSVLVPDEDGRKASTTICRARIRRDAPSGRTGATAGGETVDGRPGSPHHRDAPRAAPEGLCQLDVAPVGTQGRGVEDRGFGES